MLSGPPGSGKERLASRIVALVQATGGAQGGLDLWGEPVAAAVPVALEELEGERLRVLRPQMKSRRIGVGMVRSLEHMLHLACGPEQWKVGVVVEAERMSEQAANAFLKTLEEPPAQTLILLLTEMPEGMLPTIRSRCVRLPLQGHGMVVDEHGAKLLEVLAAMGAGAIGNACGALALRAAVAAVLAEAKGAIEDEMAELRREEEEHYKKTTESSDWLEKREDEHLAAVQSDYLRVRQRLIDLLAAWLCDVLRHKARAAEGLEFPPHASLTAGLAGRHDWRDLLERMDAFEDMRRSLATNAQEQLAMEAGFLKAFG
jgi:DNA polymerase-3 subunit delta'